MQKILGVIATALLAFGLCTGNAVAADGYTKQKVVYHVNFDDPKRQDGALRNIQNHINAVGADNLDLRVVMHGNGVALVLLPDAIGKVKAFKTGNATDAMQPKIDGLKNQGVQFKVCNNTLKGRGVNAEEHLYNVDAGDIVPSGVAELAKLQGEGFAYIKP